MLQLELPLPPAVGQDHFAQAESAERGAIYTRGEVVEFILDLVGYTEDKCLRDARLLEPSFGGGDFLLPAVRRLLASYRRTSPHGDALADLGPAIRAVEAHAGSANATRAKLAVLLRTYDLAPAAVDSLLDAWLVEGDFLLADLPFEFTHVVGNPPYVRQEMVPDRLMAEYRRRYQTIYDRADLYVPFIERGLHSLSADGVLGFICSDRWMKNRYGEKLRGLVSQAFDLTHYVDMVDTAAFHSDVSAYPAIIVLRRGPAKPTRVAFRPELDRASLSSLAAALTGRDIPPLGSGVCEVAGVVRDGEPWILHAPEDLALVRRLEATFPALEEAGCKVGIGVATGADQAFIGPFAALDVEDDRKLRLLKTRDIKDGQVDWQGDGVVNPFKEDGTLVDLEDFPRLRRYFMERSAIIRNRNCAKRNPLRWYRTIDRISPDLVPVPKLLIPDIKGTAHVVYEGGGFYPHHNLYFVTSSEWPLRVLQAVLMSGIATLFVSAYSTEMRGGFLRFQAQYLRRIRLPQWSGLPKALRESLISTVEAGDVPSYTAAVFAAYGLSEREKQVVLEHNDGEGL